MLGNQSNSIDIAAYLREIRTTSRKQFEVRALRQKAITQLQAAIIFKSFLIVGIPLCAAVAMVFALKHGRPDLPYAFNRKEAKDHGEGGVIVGGPLKGRVLLIDDVITAGTAISESVQLLGQFPECKLVGVIVALDRQEKATAEAKRSAVQLASAKYGIKIYSIIQLSSILTYARQQQEQSSEAIIPAGMEEALEKYRQQYGV
ncbi:Orotate phosphoribosyltransferase, putative [Perkinsus marinus ATCC 50983]|uniref:orotate phosphoribosyltransferase n=1 Tax=Perkinsus marinus (strain ATCC 50983 / TXsc) TaxID=423536 RepID=C5M1C4_PERM5|nr:Orotate phosphoribosyltransferase, putative [Perkinsus marinus ATCC 50983]EEQ97246.1 Orotate phosphoribosyltransferase, putative [Perkinsus marinus ATCC 50983]|eukprot:XP_002764529.1 Orotate phosphoribosyltransferase, putative [Perkinsus marinus ATCC 50983]